MAMELSALFLFFTQNLTSCNTSHTQIIFYIFDSKARIYLVQIPDTKHIADLIILTNDHEVVSLCQALGAHINLNSTCENSASE